VSNALPISGEDPFAGTVINVRDAGAEGDGTTDDTASLQAAIAKSNDGDAIYFPPGIYLVGAPLVPKPRQVYFSLTGNATVKAKDGTAFTLFRVETGPVEFHHLTLDLSKPPEVEPPDCETPKDVPAGIVGEAAARGTVDLVVASCRIQHSRGQGIRVRGGGDEDLHDRVVIRDTVVEDCCESGLALGRVNGARVEACRFERCRNGMVAASCRNVAISAATAVHNRRHGIAFRFSHDWHVHDCVVNGNGGLERDSTKRRGWGIAAGGGPEKGVPNSDFTITNNICHDNYAGGITLDPTFADDPETDEEESLRIFAQRACVSGNVCRGRRGGPELPGQIPLGTHGIHVRNSSDVVVTDNLCHENHDSGIQIVNASHVLVQANACYDNRNGIGLFSRTGLRDPAGPVGGHAIGPNMLYRNTHDLMQGGYGDSPRAIPRQRLYGMHGTSDPECTLPANPGTLFEWHDERDRAGTLYVKARGSSTEGWVRVSTEPERPCGRPPQPPIKPT
jgi:parallel beta-helix repeat protein